MAGRAVDLDKHGLALLAAKGDVVSGRAAASWALFAYEKANDLKLLDSGAGGPDELAKRFQSGNVMYGLIRLPDGATGQQHIVLINWVGEKVSEQRRQACAGHLPAIRAFFKEANVVVKASRAEEVTQDGLSSLLSLAAPPGKALARKGPFQDPEELVGTNYKKTNPALEIMHTKRSSFWAQAEREEEERRQEERRRAQEERRRWERQRMEEERRQAAERERRVQEREQLIQEQRKLQAQQEAEERRSEEVRRQREAAASGLQHLHGPWDVFQLHEHSGSPSEGPSSPRGQPGVPRRPFFRYQRGLTKSAYIFRPPDPPHSPSSGSFLPSGLPPGAASFPSPHQHKLRPSISPKPGPVPPAEGRSPPSPTVASASPPTEARPPASPLSSAPEAGGGQSGSCSPPTPNLGSPSPLVGNGAITPSSPDPGPCRASAPLPNSPPQPRPLPKPRSSTPSPQVEPTTPGEAGSCPPLGACSEEIAPHTGTSGPSSLTPDHSRRGSQAQGEGEHSRSPPAPSPPTNGFLQDMNPATDGPPAPSQAELVPSSEQRELGAVDEGKWPRGHELGTGGQVLPLPAGTHLPGAALGDPGAGEEARNGEWPNPVEGRACSRNPGLQAAEA